MYMVDHKAGLSPRRTATRRRMGPAVAGLTPFLVLGAALVFTVTAPPVLLLWVLGGGIPLVFGCVISLMRAERRGLHLHAGAVLHSHRAGWKPHAHPSRGEALLARWERWTDTPAPPDGSANRLDGLE